MSKSLKRKAPNGSWLCISNDLRRSQELEVINLITTENPLSRKVHLTPSTKFFYFENN